MKKSPETVSRRIIPILAGIKPSLSHEEATEVADKLWYVLEFFATHKLKEECTFAVEFGVAQELALANGDVVGYCQSIKAPRTLSADIKKQRTIDKIRKVASEMGITVEIKED